MTALLSAAGWAWLYAGIAALATALVICVVAGVWHLVVAAMERRVTRELDELDSALPNHAPGPIRTGRADRRKLHRDLVLLLVVNSDHEDA